MLGVHVNTVRAWTDQGRLPCLRINARGDRRYSVEDLREFIERAQPERPNAQPSTLQRDARDDRRRAELLFAISTQMGTQLDLAGILDRIVESAQELFGADHAAIFSRRRDGGLATDASRNLSADFIAMVEGAPGLPLVEETYRSRRVVSVADYHLDPRSESFRGQLLAEGINTVTIAPLLAQDETRGVLALYHDRPYSWQADDLALLQLLADQGGAAMHNARMLSRTSTWAAQLQSIQQLGSRINGLDDPREIGHVIVNELGQLIDYHNVRVYRVEGDDVVPVAWRGQVGEYADEDGDQLRLKVGQGITGWVARHGVAQNLSDAANDPRSETIPGTEDDLKESLLVAPMLHEDRVIGVLVLAKLGLNQFSEDDQRLLEIFAAMAAQAMAKADATELLRLQSERLARQLAGQRELLSLTESILSTLDPQALLDEIADRIAALLPVDNICVDLLDERTGMLQPIFARGRHAELYMAHMVSVETGICGEAARTGEAILVRDLLGDSRVAHFSETGPLPGALIALPLRGRDRVKGVLSIERLGTNADFTDDEFELAKLFAGHVSIALQNAEVHHAVELKAQTDALTGLLNHGALIEKLDEKIAQELPFGLLMIDLDDFKGYNDRFGHRAGDALLGQLAAGLRDACRESDEIFRYGGDEFAILLPNASPIGAMTVARKVHASVRATAAARRAGVELSCSIGVATHPLDGEDADSMLLAADRACYVAKRRGRNRIASAAEGLALAGEFLPPPPTPVDAPESSYPAA